MARKRMIDPGIWQSEDFAELSTLAKLVFIGLFSNADDSGRGRAKAAYIKSILFPYDEGMRVIDIDKTLSEIASKMSVTFYLHDDSEYYSLDKWSKWQRIDKPSESNLPPLSNDSAIIRRMLGERSANARLALPPNRIEENRKEEEENTTLRTRNAEDGGGAPFEKFWQSYPKKKSKGDAEKAWKAVKPSKELVAIIFEKLAQAKTCYDWTKEGGKYIPYPASWLRAKGWEDEESPKACTPRYSYPEDGDEDGDSL